MQCHCYLIESTVGGGEWMVAAEDDDKALASLPPENAPYNIIHKTDAIDCKPFSARCHPTDS